MSAVLLACRVVIVLVFLASLVSKARDPGGFVRAVTAFGLFPALWSLPVAVLVTLAEVTSVALLLVPVTTGLGFVVASVLLVTFAGGVARVLLGGRAIDCHCFGSSRPTARWTPVVRNVVLIVLSLAGLALTAVATSPSVQGMTAIGAVVVAVVAAALLVRSEDLVDVLAPRAVTQA